LVWEIAFRRDAMTNATTLRRFRSIRDLINDIQQTAAAVDEHVGRFQIYGTTSELDHAIVKAESLREKLQMLELKLGRCAYMGSNGISNALRSAQSSSEECPVNLP
jgi:hypothetical protein